MAQRLVNVIKAFSLNLNRTGTPETLNFDAGVQRVDDDIAEHWYAKAHFGDMPSADAQVSPESAAALAELKVREEALAAKEQELSAHQQIAKELTEELHKARDELHGREAELDVRKAELDQREADLQAREDKLAAVEQSASTGTRKAGTK